MDTTSAEERKHVYAAIDLKSFYSSVECVARGLDPLTTNLVVADVSRTEKTICLAVSPSLKAYGLGGRARLFEVIEKMRQVNAERLKFAPGHRFTGKSTSAIELAAHPEYEADYIAATPRMAEYIRVSSQIYAIYLKYIAPEDIHVYSVDEIFADLTTYLSLYKMTAHELTMTMVKDVLKSTGITATAGIGTNMYLCKVAMDIVAKHIPADNDGVRIAELDEMKYRQLLWSHTPLTDFWRFGHGTVNRLASMGIRTMGDLARFSLTNEDILYRTFGVNAELIIDHAWGWEPVEMRHIKAYSPQTSSLSIGQVLQSAYTFAKARVVAMEMGETLSLDLLDQHRVTSQIVVTVGYDHESLLRPEVRSLYHGSVAFDHYGRVVPKYTHGSLSLEKLTSSSREIVNAVAKIFDKTVNKHLLVRAITVVAADAITDVAAKRRRVVPEQLDLFADRNDEMQHDGQEDKALEKEHRLQEITLKIKKEFGKNSLLRGFNFTEGATQKERNRQIGGHKA